MLINDTIFTELVHREVGGFPFKMLPATVRPAEAATRETLQDALLRVFSHPEAASAREVVFFWAVGKPFVHENGKQLPSTVSYIEITRRSIKNRWPRCHIVKLCRDRPNKDDPPATGPLHVLADRDKNFSFYSRLVREHGGLSIYYATLADLNAAAVRRGRPPKASVREWEKCLIHAYRREHGVRPLKNRRG